ncbi:ubiquitin-related domain-containing protein [Lasiosphaeria ovina]|uniref:Ubiquitin-related domain-containing protein n=1 Tax=Lasiosphaeria ovina TaxID=92902 RepID=A0AAE0JSJ5_9PEZI|nr:ubiquitin-related domain-containing protein [Lasiosphaeria ovina]
MEASQSHIEGEFSLPVPAKEDVPSADLSPAPTAAESASKGKDKDDAPAPIEKQSEDDSLSIEPSDPPVSSTGANAEMPVCTITLLLPTGARHPYKIDEKYLAKRNVEIPDVTESGRKDPFSISVYKLKELILREWREEWDGKPASPTSIRLIHFGKLLDDKEQLKKYQFTIDSPNVVHMSVRPPEMMEEDEAGKGKSTSRDGRSREGGGGCCVIL